MGKLLKISLIPVILTLGVAGATAGTYYSTNVVGDGNGWFTGSMWRTNDGTGNPGAIGVNPQPSAGNIYIMVQGGRPAIGNNLGETRVRNIYTNNTLTTYFTFPGDSLELRTNTEIRFKQLPTPSTIENVNFPGVGGNPGLILNGGMLNVGDGIAQPVLGIMQAKAGSQSYLCPGGNDFQTLETARGLNILAKIVDSGTLCVVQDSTNTPVAILSTNNTYSGLWLVKAGRLRGGAPGSLGTNSSFVMDPNYTLPVPPFDASSSAAVAGPAVLEPAYDLNSAGTLVLTNGGKMRLHQNCAFTAVNIENSVLLAGTHYYAELITNFPNSFDTGGSGAITVQPYGNLPALGPLITTQPAQQLVYAGHTAHFSVAATDNGAPPLTYQWQRYTTNLVDGGNISGSTTATLTVNNVAAADATAYHVVVNNTVGPVTSADAQLTIVSPSGEAYEAAVLAANAAVFYQLNETGDPGTNGSPVFDFAGGFNGTYGTGVQNGNPNYNVAGPRPSDTMTGFSSGNTAARFANANINARVTVSPWNLNTNAVTLTAWVNPNGPQNLNEGIAVCRGGNTVAGLCYGSVLDSQSGSATITYNWDNELETFSWDTGISPPAGQWSLIAAVITPTNATVHMMNANGIVSASRKYNHVLQGFSGTTTIGDDSSGSAGNRVFDGLIDDVAVFKYALSKTQLFTLFTTASGVSTYAPSIASQPTNASPYAGQTVVLSVPSGGSDPLTYQWQSGAAGSYTNVPEGGRISGTGSQTLTIANVNTGDSLDYILTIVNGAGSVTSSVANLNVQITSPAENITLNVQQAAGSDWDNATGTNAWSDNLAASVSSAQKPGSTYELLAPARLRTPTAPQNAVFPGLVLTVDGDSVWNVNPPTNATISEIRFKQPTFPNGNGSVFFKQLRMNGGQLDAGADSGGGINTIVVNGEIDILANTPINNDNGADRGYIINSYLTGSANIEYHGYAQGAFQPTYTNTLNIAGTSNTFSGKWNVVMGTLLGTAPGSLGTNDITVGAQGAFETTYNVNNTNANLFINGGGRVYLHQTHTFKTVVIGGVPLAAGNYTFAQLNSSYPTNFPATWPVQNGGASPAVGSGSITVLVTPAPSIATQPVSITNYAGQTASFICIPNGTPPLTLLWYKGATGLSDGGRLFGSGTTNLVITNIVAGDAGNYTFVVSNIYGSATSSVASLTVLPLTILTNPVSLSLYAGMTAQFNVTALGNTPLTYQWRKGGVGVSNGGNVSGADTASLVITNVGGGNAGNYDVIVTSPFESATSTVASLSILPPAVNLTLNYGGNPIQEAQGLDWDSPTNWSDGFAASTSAAFNPGVSYEVPAGARLRSPAASDASSFPGQVLKIDGSGVWVNGSDATIGEVRFKHNDGGTVFIPRLVMNGGELDTGDNGVVILRGRIDILANTPIYVDSAANLDRSYQIDSFLTGNGTIEFHQFSASLSNNTLNVTGTTNTFSGNWNIVQGTVLGSGNNSLGSGNINIEGGGALETLYDINSPNSSLTNNGQMFLHRNDTFGAVYINGTPLANGTYSFATLNATYPGNFPASWATQRGSTVNTGSGSITVVGIRPSIGASFSGAQLTLSWPSGYYLIEANNVTGPWTTNTSATSPLIVTPTAPKHFYGLQPQ